MNSVNNDSYKNCLIAPNSFKECSNSIIISKIIYRILHSKLNFNFIQKPISDGGDGFIDVCKHYFNGKNINYTIPNSYNSSKLQCEVLYSKHRKTVYIESANVLGLKLVPNEMKNPLYLSSKGLGELLLKLTTEKINIEKVIIGIGGTATIDMGLGACSVFGLKLFDENNKELENIPGNFHRIRNIKWQEQTLSFDITTILDVENPLTGINGAANVFGRQKGADDSSIRIIEKGFNNIVNILYSKKLIDSTDTLSGAGGGILAGLGIFLKAKQSSAAEFILQELEIEDAIKKSDIVITGEGAFDEQSLMGKGAGIIVNTAKEFQKEIILICGKIDKNIKSKLGDDTTIIELISFFRDETESIENFELGIRKACNSIIRMIK